MLHCYAQRGQGGARRAAVVGRVRRLPVGRVEVVAEDYKGCFIGADEVRREKSANDGPPNHRH